MNFKEWYVGEEPNILLDEDEGRMKDAFEEGEKQMKERILLKLYGSRDRDPAMQKAYSDIEALD